MSQLTLGYRYNNFDLLRLLAALEVLFIHGVHHLKIENTLLTMFYQYATYFPGVPIFFFISGYLITMSYENKSNNLSIYITNRIRRIYPALYVCFFVTLCVLFYYNQLENKPELYIWMMAQLSFVQFYNPSFLKDFGLGSVNGTLWTISVELVFYASLPFIMYIFNKNKYTIILLFIFSAILYQIDLSIIDKNFYLKLLHISLLPYLWMFIIGIYFYKFNYLKVFVTTKFILFFFLYILVVNLTNSYTLIMFCFSFLVFAFAFSFNGLSTLLLRGNDFTYGTYIYHSLVLNIFVINEMFFQEFYLYLFMIISTTIGALSWFVIEKPILNRKRYKK